VDDLHSEGEAAGHHCKHKENQEDDGRAMAKSTLAIVAVAADTPEKPRKPAISETTRKIRAHFSTAMPPIVSE
jgi:hypothetical protein